MSSKIDILLDEQQFPYIGMSKEERNYYLDIIRNCKDVCNTENKVNNIDKCEIVQMHFRKDNNVVKFSGFLTIGGENRCMDGDLFLERDSVIVDYKITRLCADSERKIYTVLDEFKLENNILKRRSQYNYNMQSIYDEVNDEIAKGRLK